MIVWAISDLHLSFSFPKPMDVFGEHWRDHAARVEAAWRERVAPEDVVCLPGDLSWALRLPEARPELEWLGALPGRKVLVRGNHDNWWSSVAKIRAALPPGVHVLQNDALLLDGVAFAGARGWVDRSLDFRGLFPPLPGGEEGSVGLHGIRDEAEDARIYRRELDRLAASLGGMDPGAKLRVALLHFPPSSPDLEETDVTRLLEAHGVDLAVFGHLHGSGAEGFRNPYGERGGVRYFLASADFVGFAPLELARV